MSTISPSVSTDNQDAKSNRGQDQEQNQERETVTILVLETDTPHPETQERKGSFGNILDTLLNNAGSTHTPPLSVTTKTHYVVDDPSASHHGHVPTLSEIPDSIRAILITGSMYDAHGDEKWITELLALLRSIWLQRPDVLFSGVCFGHQILARLLGAKISPHPGEKWELAHTEMHLNAIGKRLFRTEEIKLSLHQMHQDLVTEPPSHKTTDLLSPEQKVHVWASTDHTEVQGLYIRDRIFTTQGHLGFDESMVKRQIEMRVDSGGIEDERFAQRAMETAHMRHDGEVVAAAVVRFFHGDDHDIV